MTRKRKPLHKKSNRGHVLQSDRRETEHLGDGWAKKDAENIVAMEALLQIVTRASAQ